MVVVLFSSLLLCLFLLEESCSQEWSRNSKEKCSSFNMAPRDQGLNQCLSEYASLNLSIYVNYTNRRPSLLRCQCALSILQDMDSTAVDINNFCNRTNLDVGCIALCYNRNGGSSLADRCNEEGSCDSGGSIDVCIVKRRGEGEGGRGGGALIYGASCDTLSKHAQGVCDRLSQSTEPPPDSKREAIIAGSVIVGLLIVIVCLSCVMILLYRKHVKSKIALDSVIAKEYDHLEPKLRRLLTDRQIELYKEQFKDVILDVNCIHIELEIGEGAFGKVFKGTLTLRDDEEEKEQVIEIALKTIMRDNPTPSQVEEFTAESAIMLDFDHPNVLKLLGVCFDTKNNLPMIVLPYMANGDLKSFLLRKRGEDNYIELDSLPEGLCVKVLIEMSLDIARGMTYLSEMKFVHRDLAARNCMIDDTLSVKVADFGLSRDIYSRDYYRLERKAMLPVKWLPPESLHDNIYNEKTDVWSYGVVLWEIFSLGRGPYAGLDNSEIPDYITAGNRLKQPPLCPIEIYSFMSYCWKNVPKERPTFRWLQEMLTFELKTKYTPVDSTSKEGEDGEDINNDFKYHNYFVLEENRLQIEC